MALIRVHFWALEPAPAFASQIVAFKDRVRAMAGPQQFLDDPPHLTLYLAAFEEDAPLLELTKRMAASMKAPAANVHGWYVFPADALTGRDTLATGFDATDVAPLQEIQRRVVEILAPRRARAITRARYDAAWSNMNATLQHNVLHSGFPYVGPIWHPHVTIASIEHAAWAPVWAALGNTPPSGPAQFPVLKWYRLTDEHPEEMLACALEAAP